MAIAVLMDGIIDTSVLIQDSDAALGSRRGDFGISVLSIAELHAGTINARSVRERAERMARLTAVEQLYDSYPVDRRMALKYAQIASSTSRRQRRPHVIDGLIAATALVLGVPVLTRDDDFDRMPGVDVVKV